MTLKERLILIFTIFATVAGLLIAVIYSYMSWNMYRDSAFETLTERTTAAQQQMETVLAQSKSASIILISDQDVQYALWKLSVSSRSDESYDDYYYSDEYTAIRNVINTYFIYITYNRLIYFNENGDVVAGINNENRSVDTTVTYEDLDWLSDIEAGETNIIPVHVDDWGSGSRVLSVVYEIVGNNLGYIEIQWLEDDLDEMFGETASDSALLIYNLNGEQVYSQGESLGEISWFDYIDAEESSDCSKYVQEKNVIFTAHVDDEYGLVYISARKENLAASVAGQIWLVLCIVILSFFLFTMILIRISTRQIAEPVMRLRSRVEQTEFADLSGGDFPMELENDSSSLEEVVSLEQSYVNLIHRLSDSLEREKKLDSLQMQAQFDLLQAQVNPHFLNNTLNVISSRGLMDDDEVICEICSNLGRMLQYSTDTKNRIATVKDEVEYLLMYCSLMKYRYGGRLDYQVDIPDGILEETMPKVILQQVVENSIHHGFLDKTVNMELTVTGEETPESWKIHVCDNGSGFTQQKRGELLADCERIREQLSGEQRETVEMKIGGMGVRSVYARLYLAYGEGLIFEIVSVPEQAGAEVVIGRNRKRSMD